MRSRLLLLPLIAVASAGLVAIASASAAQDDYPPTEPLLTVSPSTVVVGGSVNVTGEGYEPGEDVTISVSMAPLAAPPLEPGGGAAEFEVDAQPVTYTVPAVYTEAAPAVVAPAVAPAVVAAQPGTTVTADGDGAFTTSLTLTEVGEATITATGQTSGSSASVTVTVLPKSDAKDGGLPETGNSGWSLARIGATSVALGALLLLTTLIWRSRRSRANA